jgi:hypothetical protein
MVNQTNYRIISIEVIIITKILIIDLFLQISAENG